MTDRELLELAARAAGYPIDGGHYEESANGEWWVYIDGTGEPPNDSAWAEIWNPLTDDGDALRLAVKLQLNMWIGDGGTDIRQDDRPYLAIREYAENNDPYAATRRAIVRAAAEIGKGMKCS